MLKTILPIFNRGNPRIVVDWNKLLYDLTIRRQAFSVNRYMLSEVSQTPIVNMLKFLINSFDTNLMLQQNGTGTLEVTDKRIYQTYLIPLVDNLRSAFDIFRVGKPMKNLTISNNTMPYPPEIMLATTYTRQEMIPFGKGIDEWSMIRPFRIIFHDSKELIYSLHRYSLKFFESRPTYLIGGIDIPMLGLKYMAYLRAMKDEADVEHFIQYHVMQDLFDDLNQIWILNTMRHLVLNVTAEIVTPNKFKDNELSEIVNFALHPGYKALRKEIMLVMGHNVRMEDFLTTDWFGGLTLKDLMERTLTDFTIPDETQYEFARFLIEEPYIDILLTMLNSDLKVQVPNYLGSRINTKVRYMIEQHLRSKIWIRTERYRLDELVHTKLLYLQEKIKI